MKLGLAKPKLAKMVNRKISEGRIPKAKLIAPKISGPKLGRVRFK